jgi:hypothetical protein
MQVFWLAARLARFRAERIFTPANFLKLKANFLNSGLSDSSDTQSTILVSIGQAFLIKRAAAELQTYSPPETMSGFPLVPRLKDTLQSRKMRWMIFRNEP